MNKFWLNNGGVYVLVNIRGGGEFGPGWHTAAKAGKRQVGFDDLVAVAKDLIKNSITSWIAEYGVPKDYKMGKCLK